MNLRATLLATLVFFGSAIAAAQLREVTVSEIAGVVQAGAKWTVAWQGTDNADGIIGTADGGLAVPAHLSLGVELRTGVRIGTDLTLSELKAQGYAAIFLGVGSMKSRDLTIPGLELDGVLRGIDYLLNINLGYRVEMGRRIIVIGGHQSTYVGLNDTTIFNPTTESWSAGAPMTYARWYPTATALADGKILATSGAITARPATTPAARTTGSRRSPRSTIPL